MAVEFISKIKSPLKYGTRPRSNSQPLYLQSDMHLQSDTLSSALRVPLKVLSHEMNVSSGVSKVNSIYVYIMPKHFLFSGYPNDPYILVLTLNLTSDLIFRNCIESGAYFLYSLRLEFQIWCVNAFWDDGVSHTIYKSW